METALFSVKSRTHLTAQCCERGHNGPARATLTLTQPTRLRQEPSGRRESPSHGRASTPPYRVHLPGMCSLATTWAQQRGQWVAAVTPASCEVNGSFAVDHMQEGAPPPMIIHGLPWGRFWTVWGRQRRRAASLPPLCSGWMGEAWGCFPPFSSRREARSGAGPWGRG